MNYRVFTLIVLITTCSCDVKKAPLSEEEKSIVGYWVPKNIDWLKPDSSGLGLDSVLRYSDFETLCFSEGQFDLINSTNSYSIGDDSLVFEFEPGLLLSRGKWELKDSQILVEYKFKFSAQYPSGNDSKPIKESLTISPDKSEITFHGQRFVKTIWYAKASINRIEAYRASDTY